MGYAVSEDLHEKTHVPTFPVLCIPCWLSISSAWAWRFLEACQARIDRGVRPKAETGRGKGVAGMFADL